MTASAAEVIESLTDAGSWRTWDERIDPSDHGDAYSAQRRRAAEKSGADESVVTGGAAILGVPVALVVGEFGYLAGSIGHDAANRIIDAYERATKQRLPLIAAPASGGTRMQEGTPAFLRMAGIAAAAADHRAAGLPSLALLRGPTTGGVLATWGSLGHVTFAEPGALVGFLGPRVYQEMTGAAFPSGVQTAENLYRRGVIDGVADLGAWREVAGRFLAVTARHEEAKPEPALDRYRAPTPPHPDPDAWRHVQETRRADRPGMAEWLSRCATDVLPLPGTGAGERATGAIVALAKVSGHGAVIVGQDRAAQDRGELIGPWTLRAAQRGMGLAAELGLPLVTVIDTPGAQLTVAAEEGAIAGEIARCLAALARLPVPTVSVLLGQGTGGGAIALLPCDAVVAAENAWVTPLPLEGAAAIVHRDAARAPQMAAVQRITAAALQEVGAVDTVVAEQGDWIVAIGQAVGAALGAPRGSTSDLIERRRRRWRNLTVAGGPPSRG